ncbi:hypothetical protein [Phenylobacterium sp.]|uniref:hypothetical protein n=1 Tax=Phenylobacterium sp. TaxID=1871053 RepID=UPI0025FBE986|nr:hypothetical protein [Phenylobacterium sp.]MCA3740505.1 hypothetical protein [Phenylobacterium sp.]
MGPEEIARQERATGSDVQGCGPVMAEPGPEPKVMLGDQGYDADVILIASTRLWVRRFVNSA